MTNDTNTQSTGTVKVRSPAREILARHGFSGWPALRAVVDFQQSPEAAVDAACLVIDGAGTAAEFDAFMAERRSAPAQRRYPEYIPSHADLWNLAQYMLESFIDEDME